MNAIKKTLVALVAVFISCVVSHAQNAGYVDSQKVLGQVPEYTEAMKQIESQKNLWQEDISQRYSNLENTYNKYRQTKSNLSATQRKELEDQILEEESQIKKYEQELFGQNGKMEKFYQSLISPIMDRFNDAVQVVAIRNSCSFVLDMANSANVLYFNSKFDLTQKVIDVMLNEK